MKYVLCAGWGICQRVHFPVFSLPECCWLPDLPPSPPPLQPVGLTCPSPSILGTTWAASRCSGAWGWGSAAAPPSPVSTVSLCKAKGQLTGAWEHPPAPIPLRARRGQGLSPSSVIYGRYLEFAGICSEQLLSISAGHSGCARWRHTPRF